MSPSALMCLRPATPASAFVAVLSVFDLWASSSLGPRGSPLTIPRATHAQVASHYAHWLQTSLAFPGVQLPGALSKARHAQHAIVLAIWNQVHQVPLAFLAQVRCCVQ